MCVLCDKGAYCPKGSSAPTPCAGGTYLNATGATSATACEPVQPDEWAPTGSELPLECPASGFICPGRDHSLAICLAVVAAYRAELGKK